ncbi:hypothetical protein [Fictibacillus sp. S7]|uniref:hypothetical protein n=1 Tax=Fictibacillus sp. S7 TaxID=2212476 RepID=UPI0013E98A19|nr:hypothetical protein [Fictibacillus sp. S7]
MGGQDGYESNHHIPVASYVKKEHFFPFIFYLLQPPVRTVDNNRLGPIKGGVFPDWSYY